MIYHFLAIQFPSLKLEKTRYNLYLQSIFYKTLILSQKYIREIDATFVFTNLILAERECSSKHSAFDMFKELTRSSICQFHNIFRISVLLLVSLTSSTFCCPIAANLPASEPLPCILIKKKTH